MMDRSLPVTRTQLELAHAILDRVGYDYNDLDDYDTCAVALGVLCAWPETDPAEQQSGSEESATTRDAFAPATPAPKCPSCGRRLRTRRELKRARRCDVCETLGAAQERQKRRSAT